MSIDLKDRLGAAVAESTLFTVAHLWNGPSPRYSYLEYLPQGTGEPQLSDRIHIRRCLPLASEPLWRDHHRVHVDILPLDVEGNDIPSKRALLIKWGVSVDTFMEPSVGLPYTGHLNLVFVSDGDTRTVEQILRDGYFFKHLRIALQKKELGASRETAERIVRRNPGNRPDSDLERALEIVQQYF